MVSLGGITQRLQCGRPTTWRGDRIEEVSVEVRVSAVVAEALAG
jgi:hypothetical protein